MSTDAIARATEMRGIDAVPDGWDVLPLKTFLRSRAERGNEDLTLLSVYRDHGVVPFGSIEGNHNKPSLDLSGYKTVREGDLVLNKMKTWQGSLAVSDYEGIVSPAYIVCKVTGDWDRRYLHHLLRSPSFIAEYASLSYGIRVGQWDMRFEDFREVLALHPPVEVQRRVVRYLDSETARIDALIDRKQRFIELLLEKRQALITSEFPSVPLPGTGSVGSTVRRLAMVSVSIGNGYVGPTRDILRDDGVRYLQSLHIKRNAIVFSPEYFVDPAWAALNLKSRVRLGDLLIVQTGDIGQATVVDDEFDGVHCHALIIARPKWDVIDPEYLGWYFSSAQGYRDLKYVQTGALHPHLNCGNVRDILVPTPSLVEQHRVVARLDAATSDIDALVDKTRASIDLLREYRTSLISAAVTGQIDIPGTETSEDVA